VFEIGPAGAEGGQRVSLTLPHPTHFVPIRTAIGLALVVLVLNIVLVWTALSLRPSAASDESQIRALIHQQIAALNNRDPAALQLTYCDRQGSVAEQIITALGPSAGGDELRVTRITDIRFIGSGPYRMATAQIALAVPVTTNAIIQPPLSELNYFRKEDTGWKMCQPNDRESTIYHL
jgi:hypothetical protein